MVLGILYIKINPRMANLIFDSLGIFVLKRPFNLILWQWPL